MATRGGSRTPSWHHDNDSRRDLIRWIDTTIRDLIRWIDTTITTRGGAGTTVVTRGGARPQQVGGRPHSRRSPGGLAPRQRLEEGADHSTQSHAGIRNGWHHVHTLDDHPGGWHTNRVSWRSILVSHLAISCRDPNRFEPAIATRGGLPTTTRIQSEAQDRVTGSFSNGRVPYTGLDTTA